MRFIIALLILSGAIIVHELGHFLTARLCGIQVDEFSVGMGPKLLLKKGRLTEFSLRLFPIGGMCVFNSNDEDEPSENSFLAAKLWKRALIIAAGPIFNFLLAFAAALIVIFSMGADPARVVSVEADSPAAAAGLREGDIITEFEGHSIANARDLSFCIRLDSVPLDRIDIEVKRKDGMHSISYEPLVTKRYLLGFNYTQEDSVIEISGVVSGYPMEKAGVAAGDIIISVNNVKTEEIDDFSEYLTEELYDGEGVDIEYLRDEKNYTVHLEPVLDTRADGGFAFNLQREKLGFFESLSYSLGEIKFNITATIRSIASLFNGRLSVTDVSGPIGVVTTIGEVYQQAAENGIFILVMSMLNILTLLSANLGVMNLLPLPALDGGRLIFMLIELFRRKPCSPKIEGAVHFAGIVVLMGLAVLIAFSDIFKLIL